MKKISISIFLIFSLLFVSLFGSTGIKNAKALSVLTISATPDTVNTISQINIVTQTTLSIPASTGFIMLTFPADFTLPSSINSNYITINSVYHPLGTVNVAGQVIWFFISTTLPAGTLNVVFSTAAGLRTPVTPGTYQLQVQTSVEAPQYGTVQIRQPSDISNTSINLVPLTPGLLVQYCYISFRTGPAGALPVGQTISLVFPVGTSLPSYVAGSITVNTVAVTSAAVTGTTLNIAVPAGVVIGNNTQVNLGISSTYGMLNPLLPGDYQVQISTTADSSYALTPVYEITGASITNLTLQVSPLNPGVPATYRLYFTTSLSGALAAGDTLNITFPAGTLFPYYLNTGLILINNVVNTSAVRYGNTLALTIPYYVSIPANGLVQVMIPASLGICNPPIGNYNLIVATSKDTSSVLSTYYQIFGSSIYNLSETVTPSTQGAPANFNFVFTTSSGGILLQNSGSIFIDFPPSLYLPNSISAANVTVNGIAANNVTVLSGQILKITTPFTIGAFATLTVAIASAAKIKNPTSAVGSSIVTAIYTSADTVPANCIYLLTASTITVPQVTFTSSGTDTATGLALSFNTGYNGALQANSDRIIIIFPSTFILPVNFSKTLATVNGYSVANVYSSGNRLEITPNIGIAKNSKVNVVLDTTAGIKNPSTPAAYLLQVSTTAETGAMTSNTFNVIALPETISMVTPASPDGLNDYYKTSPTILLSTYSPTDPSPTIFYSLNGATFQLYTGKITIPEGNVILSYYAKDSVGNLETTKTLNFKVDSFAPIISITTPTNNAFTNQATLKIIGKTEAGAKLTLNNTPIKVAASGDFTTTFQLTEGAQTISFLATDAAGNLGTYQLTINLDSLAPKLTLLSPLMFSTTTNKVCQVIGSTEPGTSLVANQKIVLVKADGTFSFELPLTEGQNTIEIIATDLAGNSKKNSLIVTYVNKTTLWLQVGNTAAKIGTRSIHLLAAPINFKGTVMVPLRFISEAFGANVEWFPVFKSITIKLDRTTITLQIGNLIAAVSGKTFKLLAAPILKNSTTLVPIRFVSEVLGASVTWVQKTQVINITYPKS